MVRKEMDEGKIYRRWKRGGVKEENERRRDVWNKEEERWKEMRMER